MLSLALRSPRTSCFSDKRAETLQMSLAKAHADRIGMTTSVVTILAVSEHPLRYCGSSQLAVIVYPAWGESYTSDMFTNLILAVRNRVLVVRTENGFLEPWLSALDPIRSASILTSLRTPFIAWWEYTRAAAAPETPHQKSSALTSAPFPPSTQRLMGEGVPSVAPLPPGRRACSWSAP